MDRKPLYDEGKTPAFPHILQMDKVIFESQSQINSFPVFKLDLILSILTEKNMQIIVYFH